MSETLYRLPDPFFRHFWMFFHQFVIVSDSEKWSHHKYVCYFSNFVSCTRFFQAAVDAVYYFLCRLKKSIKWQKVNQVQMATFYHWNQPEWRRIYSHLASRTETEIWFVCRSEKSFWSWICHKSEEHHHISKHTSFLNESTRTKTNKWCKWMENPNIRRHTCWSLLSLSLVGVTVFLGGAFFLLFSFFLVQHG